MPRTSRQPAVGGRKTYAGKPVARGRDGYTPRERLDHIHSLIKHQQYLKEQGRLVDIEQVEAGHAEMREVIRSDLLGTLPLRVAELLADKIPAQEVRGIVLGAVREIINGWNKAGLPTPEDQ